MSTALENPNVRRSERLAVRSRSFAFSAVAPTAVTVPVPLDAVEMESDDDEPAPIVNKFHKKPPIRYTNIQIQGDSMQRGSVSQFYRNHSMH